MSKAYKGIAMEGPIAMWYTRNTARDLSRFEAAARLVAGRAAVGSRVLEVAPGPGYLAVALAARGYAVAAVDISESFVRIARRHAENAGVAIDIRRGDAARMPFDDASFDVVVCVAAFKNFADPLGALDDMHRVLRPGGQAVILDLRKDASRADIDREVDGMRLSPLNAALTRWTFRFMLLKRAYSRGQLETMARRSRFGGGEIVADGIGYQLRLARAN